MKRRIKKNQKGSVLLTVICFTTVCMLLASTALSLANYSSKVSNNNIRSTQAEITAQNYLQEYINSFAGNYDDLASLAGTSESSPSIVNVSMQDSAGNTISDAGTCQIKIYKSGSGVVVKSEATYAGETEVASAFFEVNSTSTSLTPTSILTSDGINTNNVATPMNGDIHIENSDMSKVTTFSQDATFYSNIYIQNNVKITNNCHFNDTIKKKALTLSSKGYIYFPENSSGTDFKTNIGKTDNSGNNSFAGAAYPSPSGLSNTDGFINTDKKIILGKANIGESGKPIDIYSYGAYIGAVPKTLLTSNDNKADYDDIDGVFNEVGTINDGLSFYGNLYCYTGAASGSYQNGSLVLNKNNTTTINGDVYVEGNIYLVNGTLKITGNLYCGGKVYDDEGKEVTTECDQLTDASGDNIKTNNIKNASVIGNSTRNKKPSTDYDPVSGTTKTQASVYAAATTNDMFLNSKGLKRVTDASGILTTESDTKVPASKELSTLYLSAYNSWNDNPSNSSDDYDWAKGIYLDEDCTVSLYSAILDCKSDPDPNQWHNKWQTDYRNNFKYNLGDNSILYVEDNYKYNYNKIKELEIGQMVFQKSKLTIEIKVTNSDIVFLIPSGTTLNQNEGYETFKIDTSECSGDYFCYFMIYNPDINDTDGYYYGVNYLNAKSLGTVTKEPELNFGSKIKITEIKKNPDGTKYEVVDNYVAGTSEENRVFILLPDESKCTINGNGGKINAIIYGMKSDIKITGSLTQLYGQIYSRTVDGPQDNKNALVNDVPYAHNSIFDFIAYKNSSSTTVKLEYFTKYKS